MTVFKQGSDLVRLALLQVNHGATHVEIKMSKRDYKSIIFVGTKLVQADESSDNLNLAGYLGEEMGFNITQVEGLMRVTRKFKDYAVPPVRNYGLLLQMSRVEGINEILPVGMTASLSFAEYREVMHTAFLEQCDLLLLMNKRPVDDWKEDNQKLLKLYELYKYHVRMAQFYTSRWMELNTDYVLKDNEKDES